MTGLIIIIVVAATFSSGVFIWKLKKMFDLIDSISDSIEKIREGENGN